MWKVLKSQEENVGREHNLKSNDNIETLKTISKLLWIDRHTDDDVRN